MRTTSKSAHVRQIALTSAAAVAVAAAAFTSPVFSQGGAAPATPPAAGAQAGAAPAQQPGRGNIPAGRGGGSTVGAAAPRNIPADYAAKPPVRAQSPEDEAKTFILPPGYRMELVMAEPNVINPVAMAWDGNGRMYIAEMRTYMPDADGSNQHVPENVISVHESSKGDGTYDVHKIFQDKLILPRMVLPLDKGVLTNETDSNDVIRLEDTNGDGVADKRSVFYTGVGLNRDGNLEHEQSGFVWGLDNWIYSTYNAFRFRWTPSGTILREPTGPNGGQWGLSMDDDGKIWWVDAGGERGPTNFQVPIHYGSFNLQGERAQNARPGAFDQFEPNFEIVYPAPGWGDVQGGMDRVRVPINNLNHFTSTNGQEIVRSDRYPDDLNGDLLFNEPVGRLIRRAKIVKTEGLTQLKNAYPGSEFIVSTDPVFRPVNIKQGPDGALYILDMYHGIIQESTWTPKGSYLRRKIEQYAMEKVVGHGRIWRLRYDGIPATAATDSSPAMPGIPAMTFDNTKPRMLDETPAQLVAHLSHSNGWWRDTAQRLLVLKQDKSVVPALQGIVRSSPSLVGRFHALWTLEGLNALDASLLRDQMKDPNARMRVQAIRASETLYKAGNRTFDADYRAMAKDADADVAIQSLVTMKLFNLPDFAETAKSVASANARGVREFADLLTRPAPAAGGGRGGAALAPEVQQMMERGGQVFTELCFSCHGEDGRGRALSGGPVGTMMAPALAGSPRVNGHRDYIVKVLLNGLTGPIADNTYSEVMIPMRTNTDEWVASVATYVRSSFGNTGGTVSAADVARVRAATASRKGLWTEPELVTSLPRMMEVQPTWKATASHNTAAAPIALTLKPWSSNAAQAPGMWYQVELPQPVMLTEIQFDSSAAGGRGGGGGGRGFAGPPAPGTPPPAPNFTAPRGYKVDVSLDGTKWSAKPVATGASNAASTTITFAPVRAKFVRITQTAAVENAPNWAMTNVRLFEAVAAPAK